MAKFADDRRRQGVPRVRFPPLAQCYGSDLYRRENLTRLHYLEAARYFQDAADLVPTGHPDEKGQFLFAKAGALLQQGDERADNSLIATTKSVWQAPST